MQRGLLGLALVSLSCGDISTEVAIGFERPRDDGPLGGVDNLTVSLTPDGFSEQLAIDGPDAEVEFGLPPDDTARSLSVFFARGESLIAYGKTPPFTFAGAAGAGVVVFLGYPGTLATLDRAFDLPDASTRIAASPGRGALALGSDGSAVFLDAYSFALVPVEPFPEPVPRGSDGLFVGDASGSVTRVAFASTVSATRYVYGTDAWTRVSREDIAPRPDAGAWHDAQDEVVYIAGGGEQTSIVRVSLVDEGTALPSIAETAAVLDGPRRGAALIGSEGGGTSSLLAFGGDDPTLPLAYAVANQTGSQLSDLAWTGARCTAVDDETFLCAGGSVGSETTADGALVEIGGERPTVSRLPGLLGVPMREVLWLADESAVYAQGEGRLVRIDRASREATEPAGSPQRAVGGDAALLPTGATLIAGGVDPDGAATDVWQVFSPAVAAE